MIRNKYSDYDGQEWFQPAVRSAVGKKAAYKSVHKATWRLDLWNEKENRLNVQNALVQVSLCAGHVACSVSLTLQVTVSVTSCRITRLKDLKKVTPAHTQ